MMEDPIIKKIQSIDFESKSTDWFLYDRDPHCERVKGFLESRGNVIDISTNFLKSGGMKKDFQYRHGSVANNLANPEY